MSHAAAAVILLATACASPAVAQRIALDDSLSPTGVVAVELAPGPGGVAQGLRALLSGASAPGPTLAGSMPNVEVRLDTHQFVGASAQIYLTLPPLVSGLGNAADLELRWEATAGFLPGTVRPGQSALVFAGTVEQPVTNVVFNFVLLLDNGIGADAFELEPIYELELLP